VKKKLFCLFGCLMMTLALTGAVSNDVTAKALNDVQVERGTGCFVRDALGKYYEDPNCNWHVVITYDEGGNLIKYKYQDQGTLPADVVRPSQAIHESDFKTYDFGSLYIGGTVTETITPGGEYKSSFLGHPVQP
jgi:hypothetical protein